MARLKYLPGHVEFSLSLFDPWFRARTEGCDKMKGTPTLYHAATRQYGTSGGLINDQTMIKPQLNPGSLPACLLTNYIIMVELLSALFSVVFLLCGGAVALVLLASVWWRENSGEGLVQVVVLGDAGRSPRMQYHCLSLVQLNYNVDLIGYGGKERD